MINWFQSLLSNSTCAATQRRPVQHRPPARRYRPPRAARHRVRHLHLRHARPGKAVLVDPINPTLKAPGTNRLKLKSDEPLTNFAFNFNLRRYNPVRLRPCGNTSHGGLCWGQGLTRVPISAQRELFCPPYNPT